MSVHPCDMNRRVEELEAQLRNALQLLSDMRNDKAALGEEVKRLVGDNWNLRVDRDRWLARVGTLERQLRIVELTLSTKPDREDRIKELLE